MRKNFQGDGLKAMMTKIVELSYDDLSSRNPFKVKKARRWFNSKEEDYIFSYQSIRSYVPEFGRLTGQDLIKKAKEKVQKPRE